MERSKSLLVERHDRSDEVATLHQISELRGRIERVKCRLVDVSVQKVAHVVGVLIKVRLTRSECPFLAKRQRRDSDLPAVLDVVNDDGDLPHWAEVRIEARGLGVDECHL